MSPSICRVNELSIIRCLTQCFSTQLIKKIYLITKYFNSTIGLHYNIGIIKKLCNFCVYFKAFEFYDANFLGDICHRFIESVG